MVPGWWAGAQRTGIAAGARVWTCVYRVLSCGHRTMNRCVFSFKCGVLQCAPLNLVDIMCFGTAYDVLAGARARERTNLRCRTMSPGWRYGALVSHSKLAIRAYVDETKLYQLGIHNIQPEQRATGPLARSECDAPLLGAGPQYRGPWSTPRRRAPHRLSQPTQHRGVLGNHHANPRLDCRAAVCVQRANRARQQSARASRKPV